MKKTRRNNSPLKTIAIIFGAVLAVTYIGIALYFTGHFLFNTYVDDIYAFNKTPSEIEAEAAKDLRDYTLFVVGRGDIKEFITADEIGLEMSVDDQFKDALKDQSPFIWPKYLFGETHIVTEDITKYSRESVVDKTGKMAIFKKENMIPPVDAHVSEESGDDGFFVVPEDPGRMPIRDKVTDEICSALDVLDSRIELSDECYETPSVYSDNEELADLCDNLNKYCRAVITYEFGQDSVVVDGTRIREWCDIEGTSVTLNEEKVRDFVNSMAREYDTFGKSRNIASARGGEVSITGGDYGWWMDRASETSELIEAVKKGEKTSRIPVYFATAAQYGDNDWGDSYVEIDLTSQHLWVHKNGQVVEESDFVSGCVNRKNPTPTGSYAITYKQRDATLVGENYSSPVKYWMPFNGNVGMHDASWRSEFGGWQYITNGSHGCINLPVSKAASIFDLVEKGEAVFVYGGKTTPEAVITQEIVDPVTGEVTRKNIPVSVAQSMGITPQPEQPEASETEAPAEQDPEETVQTESSEDESPEEVSPEEESSEGE